MPTGVSDARGRNHALGCELPISGGLRRVGLSRLLMHWAITLYAKAPKGSRQSAQAGTPPRGGCGSGACVIQARELAGSWLCGWGGMLAGVPAAGDPAAGVGRIASIRRANGSAQKNTRHVTRDGAR